jgi:hypothetical protein
MNGLMIDGATIESPTSKLIKVDVSPIGTDPNDKYPWDYRSLIVPNEKKPTWEKMIYWFQLGKGRTYSKVAEHFDISIVAVSRTAKMNLWKQRLEAWNEHYILKQTEQLRADRHNEHMKKLETFRERSEALGTGLISAGAQLLRAANKSITEMQETGETLDRRLISGALNASAKVAEAGRILMAQSLGVDALMSGLDGAEGDLDEYSWRAKPDFPSILAVTGWTSAQWLRTVFTKNLGWVVAQF